MCPLNRLLLFIFLMFCFATDDVNAQRFGYRGKRHRKDRRLRNESPDVPSPTLACPCFNVEGQQQCFSYDTTFQASTLEEAIVNFPDLLQQSNIAQPALVKSRVNDWAATPKVSSRVKSAQSGPRQRPLPLLNSGALAEAAPFENQSPSVATPKEPSSGLCEDDQECIACSATLLPVLVNNGLIANKEQLNAIKKRLGINIDKNKDLGSCRKYVLPNISPNTSSSGNLNSIPVVEAKVHASNLSHLFNNVSAEGQKYWRKNLKTNPAQLRLKREADDTASSGILGRRYQIRCVKRGEPKQPTSEWAMLCDCCWMWRSLPEGYSPQYVNEVVCQSNKQCLSGWGKCQEQQTTFKVVQNIGSRTVPVYKNVDVAASFYCGCEVKVGSGITSFVSASCGVNNPLLPNPDTCA